MAATASSASNSSSHMPCFSIDSPMSRSRPSSSSPWTQIVRGGDSDLIHYDLSPSVSASLSDDHPSFSPPIDNQPPDYHNAGKKPVWNKPSNCSVDVEPVMGADSWPTLSHSARVSSCKSPSSESLKGLSDASLSMSPLQAAESPSAFTQKQSVGNINVDPNATATSSHNSQKKPFKHYYSTASAPGSVATGGSYGGGNPQHRNSYRNRNGGSYPRGDSFHQQNHGNRRNHDHGNQTVYSHRNYNGRDVHMQRQQGLGPVRPHVLMGPPSFPVVSSQYIATPHLHPYSGGPMLYPEYPAAIYMPHFPPEPMAFAGQFSPQPIYFPGYDPMLFTKIVKQVDFYFSADNLSKDKYLRQHMDDEGWVPVNLIAGFRKLAELTDNVQIILDAVRSSVVVEVQNESIRRRGDWHKYVWPRDLRDATVSTAQQTVAASEDVTLETHIQNLKLSVDKNLAEEGERRDDGMEEANKKEV